MRIETYTIGIDFEGNVASSLNQIDSKAKQVGRNISRRFKDLGQNIQRSLDRIRLPALAVTGAGVVAFKTLVSGASELEESINAVNVVFGESSEEILAFSQTADKAVGLSQKAFNQLSINTGALLKDTGLSAEELSETTIMLTKRAADLASVFNTDVNDSLSAINQALRGETEAIRRYAGDVTDATLKTFLNSEGINKNIKELTQQEKRLLRVQLIMKQTATVQDDFANTSESVANQQRIQGAQLENVADTLGQRLLPVMQSIQRVTGKVVDQFSNLSPEIQDLIVKTGLAVTAISAVLVALSFIVTPIGAVVAAISTLAFIVFDLWKAFNSGDSIIKNALESLAVKFPRAAEIITGAFSDMWDAISTIFRGITRLVKGAFRIITDGIKLIKGEITGLQFLLGEGGIEGLRNVQFAAPAFGSAPEQLTSVRRAVSVEKTGDTNTTTISVDKLEVKADNQQALVDELVANNVQATPLPAGVPQ